MNFNKLLYRPGLIVLTGALLVSGAGWSGCANRYDQGPPLSARDSLLAARFTFTGRAYKFGTAISGAVIHHSFMFTNTGKRPLIIKDVITSCGCTVPVYDKKPVLPGASGHVQVDFNTEGKDGVQQKIITITANTIPRLNQISLEGIVTNTK